MTEDGAEGGGKDIEKVSLPAEPAPAPPILAPAPAKPSKFGAFTLYQIIMVGVACAMLAGLYLGMQPIIECSRLQAEYNAGHVQKAFDGFEKLAGMEHAPNPFEGATVK